nr:unnamed protein product [Callosobruchus chinensis]
MEYVTFGEGTLNSVRGGGPGACVQPRARVPSGVQQRVGRKSGLPRPRQPPPPRRMDNGGRIARTTDSRAKTAVSKRFHGIPPVFQREVPTRRSLCHLSVSAQKQHRSCSQQRSSCQGW